VRKCITTFFLIAVSFGTGAAAAQGIDFGRTEFSTQKLTPNFYVLTGSPGTDPARLPVLTFGAHSPLTIHFDAETIDFIPLPAAHTNGDALIRFETADIIIMVGDIYRNFGYPFVDTSHGGSFKGMLAALAVLETVAGPETRLVPGHGTMIKRTDIAPYRDMIVSISNKVGQLVREGKSTQEVLAANLTAPYDAKVPGGLVLLPNGSGTTADRFVGEIYSELQAQ
jgi:cyclase